MAAATPTELVLQETVQKIVSQGSGLDFDEAVIPGNDSSGPAPRGLYATVLNTNFHFPGHSSYSLSERSEDTDLDVVVLTPVVGTWSVQWFRDKAEETARRFHAWCLSLEGLEFIESVGLTFRRCSDILRLDNVVSKYWERRSGLEFEAGFIQYAEYQVESIAHIPLVIGMSLDNMVLTENITVSAAG